MEIMSLVLLSFFYKSNCSASWADQAILNFSLVLLIFIGQELIFKLKIIHQRIEAWDSSQ